METKDFSKIVKTRFADVRETLTGKAKEYARGDRLSNFKTAAAFDKTTPEKALWGMYLKHLVSLRDFIDDLEHGVCMSWESWSEKIRDTITYALLLEGLIQERLLPQEDIKTKYEQICKDVQEKLNIGQQEKLQQFHKEFNPKDSHDH